MPLLYWALEEIEQSKMPDGWMIETDSDVACHMWLRHTLMPPQKHLKPVLIRGLLMMYDARFCFVAFDDLEQEEPGDTFHHTFIWTGWKGCMTRYFYFWATNAGEPMKSTSPIFSKHFPLLPLLQFFYPDAHPESNTVDGWVRQAVTCPECTWADMRDGPGDSYADMAYELIHQIYAWRNLHEWSVLYRSILLFDTSSLGHDVTILSARLRVKTKARQLIAETWSPMLGVVSSLPANNSALQSSDYATLGIVPLSNARGWAVFVPEATIYFDFNAAGLEAIDPEGITKLGIRERIYDLPNSPPSWEQYGYARIDLYSADNIDEPYKPRLEVTYNPP